jgi:hypothetical protein
MTEFKIEKSISIPPTGVGGRVGKYPWAEMEVGDSLFIPGKTAYSMGSTPSGWAARHPPYKFLCRTVDGGVRVWRIA